MTTEALTHELLLLIASCIDEEPLPHHADTWTEMVGNLLHCVVRGRDYEFRVHLEPIDGNK